MGARRFDVAIVGGGHNGLTCAAYLAAAGLTVCVLERRAVLGGAAVTEEFHPGFRNSTLSYTVGLLDAQVMRDLRLAAHGLAIVARPVANFLPLSQRPGDCLTMGGGLEATQREVAKFSPRDAQRLPDYQAFLERAADRLRALMRTAPPALRPSTGADLAALVETWKGARAFRAMTLAERRDLLDLFAGSAGDLLDRWFESDAIKAALGFDAIVGSYASPYAPGSAYLLLHLVLGEVDGRRGQWGHAIGGMGAITQAMAKECAARGVVLRTSAPVARVHVKAGRAAAAELESGEVVEARRIAANVNPKLLFERLLDARHVDDDFRARIGGYRCASGTFRINVALDALPAFACLPSENALPQHASGIVIAPSLRYMEQAYFDARTHGWSREPAIEVLFPSVVDATLAPPGKHVASLFCQHVEPRLPEVTGRGWDDARDAFADLAIATVDRMMPGFAARVLARAAWSPLDLEREFGLVGGDIYHGQLVPRQLFAARPVLGAGDYRMPVKGLYLCGAGAHPGGGVSGLPGRHAARAIAADARRGRH